MKIEIKELQKRDYKKAIDFSIVGMNFDWYLNSKLLLKLYGIYFWYMELTHSTQVIAAYVDNKLAGVLLADMKGEEKKHTSFWKSVYVKLFEVVQRVFYKDGAGLYDKTMKTMHDEYLKNYSPDGEIVFLAADPTSKIKGIGTVLLSELENRERGKTIFLYTDNACTYQFYEHRGFKRVSEKNIVLDVGKKKVPLQCFIYTKNIGL